MPVDPTTVHFAYKEEEEKAKTIIKKIDAIMMDAGVNLSLKRCTTVIKNKTLWSIYEDFQFMYKSQVRQPF